MIGPKGFELKRLYSAAAPVCSLVLLAGAVLAQEGANPCHALATDATRLSCYDAQTGYTGSEAGAVAPGKDAPDDGAQWLYSQETSSLDGKTDVWLSVSSENTQPNQIGRPERARLWVRCMNNSTNVFVTFNDYTPDDQNLRYKLDDGPIRKKWMISMQGGEGIGLWSGKSAIPFARAIFGKERLVLAYNSYNNFNLEFTFDVAGLRARIDPLARSCQWKP